MAAIAIVVIFMLLVITYVCWRKQQSQPKGRTQPALNTAHYGEMEMEGGGRYAHYYNQNIADAPADSMSRSKMKL